jgi:hypothetical protein
MPQVWKSDSTWLESWLYDWLCDQEQVSIILNSSSEMYLI